MLSPRSMSARPDPEPSREQDLGLFEVVTRDGAARIGRLHTRHGALNTPMLLPVVNPNLRTIEPREMWERYGVKASSPIPMWYGSTTICANRLWLMAFTLCLTFQESS